MEGVSDRRYESPGDARSAAAAVMLGSGPGPTEAEVGLGAGGGGEGDGSRSVPAGGGGRPPPQDLHGMGEEIDEADGAGPAGPPQAQAGAAPARDLPIDDANGGGFGGGGVKLPHCGAAATMASTEGSQKQRQIVAGSDAAGGVAGADEGRAAADHELDAHLATANGERVAPGRPTSPSAASASAAASAAAASPAFRAKRTPRTAASETGPMEDDENDKDEGGEEKQDDDDVQYDKAQSARTAKRGSRKKREGRSGATSGCGTSSGSATGSTRSTRRSDLKNRLEQVGVGSRVEIYWEMDKEYYPATVVAEHGEWSHTYTFLYDDGCKESFDLSHELFHVLDDAIPKAAVDAIAAGTTSNTCGGGDQDGGRTSPIVPGRMISKTSTAAAKTKGVASNGEELGEDWVCPTCQTSNPYEKKLCRCPSTRKVVKGNYHLCAIPGCLKRSQGAANNSMCRRHFTRSNDREDEDVAAAKEDSSSRKRSRKPPDRFDGQEAPRSGNLGEDNRKPEAKNSNRSSHPAVAGTKNDLTVDEISNLKARQPRKKPSSPSSSIDQGARIDDSGRKSRDVQDDDDGDENWICHGCGTSNSPERKRCAPPCLKWKGGIRHAATSPTTKKVRRKDTIAHPTKRNISGSESSSLSSKRQGTRSAIIDNPAKKKNPFANLKRRDSPRSARKHQCGHCDACMVDDCGECRCCLDMKKFGGPWKIRQKCSSRPPCYNPPSKSRTKTSQSRAPASPSGRSSGTSRAGRPPRAKAVPPPPPPGSLALDPMERTDDVEVPKSTGSCTWSFDEKTRVLLAKFNLGSSSSIDLVHKETLFQMMERDDITVVSEGLVGDLNRTLWDLQYVANLVGDKPYHKVRRFERELIEIPAYKPESKNDGHGGKAAESDGITASTVDVVAAVSSFQTDDVARSVAAASTISEAESLSAGPRQRFHVRHKEVDKNLSMKISDYCKYLDRRATALQSIMEKRKAAGVHPVNPASVEDDLIGRLVDVEGQNPESFTFLTHDSEEKTINVVDEVLYLIDYDMVKLLPPLYEDFVKNFKLPDCLPGGQQCMMNAVNINGRPFMGPNFYVTPPASFTHFHQDGHGTVDSGHTCLSGYNEVVMLRRMPEEHKQRALYILNDQVKKKRSKYDGLYGLPHGDGLGAKPDWPSVDAIEECRRMNYYPSVFVLKPGQFVHINKGRLHAFRKLSPTALPLNDCHRQLRLDAIADDKLGSIEHLCVSVAWDWMYKGCTEKGIREEIVSTLQCARLLRGHQLQSLAIPELSAMHTAIQLVAEYEQSIAPVDVRRGILPFIDDRTQPNPEAVKEKLKGMAPAMEYIIDRHERAFKAAKQQLEFQASQTDCRTTVGIAALPDAAENPESYALDPYGNGDFHCRLCHEELSNIYMHCDGCEAILNKDYNICVSCHRDCKYKEFSQMHPTKTTKNGNVNHKGDNNRANRGQCPCKNGKACTQCGYCSGCSCQCHQCFTMHMRFSSMDEMIALRERVRNIVGTSSIPTILMGSPNIVDSRSVALASSLASDSALATALPSFEQHAVSSAAMDQSKLPGVSFDGQTSSREERAKRRYRKRQLSSFSIDEEKKEDSGFIGASHDFSAEDVMTARPRHKRNKSESSEYSLSDPAFDTGGNIKAKEDLMKLDEEEEPRKPAARRKRSHCGAEEDTTNDQAIAVCDEVARPVTKTPVVKFCGEDDDDWHKIIDVEDGNSALLFRAVGSRAYFDEEGSSGENPSPKKKTKAKGRMSKKTWPASKSSSSNSKERSGKVTRLCVVGKCAEESSGTQSNNMCEEHYANSQATDRKRPRDGRTLCPVKGCPRVGNGARSLRMCMKHFRMSNGSSELDQITFSDDDKGSGEDSKLPAQEDADGEIMGKSAGTAPAVSADEEETAKPAAPTEALDGAAAELDQQQHVSEQQGVTQHTNENDDEVEVIGSTAASVSSSAALNHPSRRSESRTSSRASRSLTTSAASTPTFEPKDKFELIKKDAKSFIAPYITSKVFRKSYPAKNGLNSTVVLQLLEDHESSDPSVGMLIAALPNECGLVRDDPNHRNMIRHLYRNFQGEEDLLRNKSGDTLPMSAQERDICVYETAFEKHFSFLEQLMPYRSKVEIVTISRLARNKGLQHDKEHVAHVKRTIGLIERLEGPM